MLPSADK